jgi:hypothetical protein
MQKLEYVGDKSFVTTNGISFSTSTDRFLYINELVSLVRVLSFDKITHTVNLKEYLPKSSDESLEYALKVINKKELHRRESEYKVHLYNEIAKVKKMDFDKYTKSSYIYNLEFLFDDRVQRKFNKIIYHLLIAKLAELFVDKELKELEIPLTKSTFHILKSLINELRKVYLSGLTLSSNINKKTLTLKAK